MITNKEPFYEDDFNWCDLEDNTWDRHEIAYVIRPDRSYGGIEIEVEEPSDYSFVLFYYMVKREGGGTNPAFGI